MGLDITAYSRLKHVGKHAIDPELNEDEPGPWCYYEGHVLAYAYDSFPASFAGIPVLGKRDGFIEGGCYVRTDATQTHPFRAGSYSGYGAWRSDLREQFNPEEDPDGPFFELIYFADNEGSIGPDAARELLRDFRLNANLYSVSELHPGWWRDKYDDWTRACELAADGGLIDFH